MCIRIEHCFYDPATGITTTFGYDYENRLTLVAYPGMTAQYKYDSFGRRIEKNVNGTVTQYAYDGPNIITQYNGSGVVTAAYVQNLTIDDPLSVTHAGATYCYHKDSLGSVTDVTDSSGQTVQVYNYSAYGNIIGMSGTITQPFTFTGREFDTETGLYYYRARYYDAVTGRFITRDPLGFEAEDENLTRYARNNPVNLTDPDGFDPVDPKTGKVNNVLRCHVNPHRDPYENAIGASLVTGVIGVYGATKLIPIVVTVGTPLLYQYADKLPTLGKIAENWAQGKRPLRELWKAYNKEIDAAKANSCPPDYKKTYECHSSWH